MALDITVLHAERHQGAEGATDLRLACMREPHLPTEYVWIRGATVEPQPGDLMSFGCAGVRYDDGTIYGGHGFICIGGVEHPYRRVSCNEVVQDWPAQPPPTVPEGWGAAAVLGPHRPNAGARDYA